MDIVRRVLKNAGVVLGGSIANKILYAIILIYLARYLGSSNFGVYSFVMAYLFFFNIIPMLGINKIVVREISQNKTTQEYIIGNALSIRLLLSTFAIIIAVIIINLLNYPSDVRILVYIFSFTVLFSSISSTFSTIFEAKLRMEYPIIANFVETIISLILIVSIIFLKGSLIHIIMAFVISSIFKFLITFYFSQKFIRLKFKFDFFCIKRILYSSIPIGLSYFLWSIYYRIDVLMLSLIKSAEAVGYYSAAYTLIEGLNIIPRAILISLFPLMSKYSKDSKHLLEKIYERSFRLLLMIALPIAIIVTLFSEEIILLIYKDAFLPSSNTLSILIWSMIFLFINVLFANLLVAMNKEKMTMYISGILALVNISLNYILIPQYSYIGASIATVFTEFLGTAIYFYYIYINLIKRLFVTIILKLIAINALLYIILATFKFMPIVLLIAMSVAIYIVLLVVSKCITTEEVSFLKSVIRDYK